MSQPQEIPHHPLREQLRCNFPQIDDVFNDCIKEANHLLSEQGVKDYLKGATLVCMIGRGVEPVLVFLEEMPQIAHRLGEQMLIVVSSAVWDFSRGPNGLAIISFMQVLPEVTRRLGSHDQFLDFIDLIFDMQEQTSSSIHDKSTINTIPSPGLPQLLNQMPWLLGQLSLTGLKNWIEYGIRHYKTHPGNQIKYFSLDSADSRAILQRERHGTLLADNDRRLSLYSRGFWQQSEIFVPFASDPTDPVQPVAYFDTDGMRLPDVYDDHILKKGESVSGINRYRASIAHMQAHRRWSQQIIVDNFSPFQRVGIECFEDSRVELLAMQVYPGLKRLWKNLHPKPIENDCDPSKQSCIKHRLAMLSYAILEPQHAYTDPDILEFVEKFHQVLKQGESSLKEMAQLAVSFIARTRRQSDQLAEVYFKDSTVSYRDDNRHLWIYIEESDDEEAFSKKSKQSSSPDEEKLPPRHYPEWDYASKSYRPDWVSLYENLHPPGNAAKIDELLSKHAVLAKRLKYLLDALKPQNLIRQRYQEEGSELDLDVAIRSLIDFRSGARPDPRINISQKTDGRDIAVSLLIDLSASVDEIPTGSTQSILELSQEAVALLAWAIDQLGDKFAIAGFHSNTRHEVRFQHIKGFQENWDETVKGRMAAMQAGYSTRMGAAIRHAGHYLEHQQADKKLLLILTDGEPADIDVMDDQSLHEDAKKAVSELSSKDIYTYAISLDAQADEYVSHIFGNQYSVIDRVDKLPEKLPQLFLALTR